MMAPAVLLPLCAFDAPAGEYTTSLGTTAASMLRSLSTICQAVLKNKTS